MSLWNKEDVGRILAAVLATAEEANRSQEWCAGFEAAARAIAAGFGIYGVWLGQSELGIPPREPLCLLDARYLDGWRAETSDG